MTQSKEIKIDFSTTNDSSYRVVGYNNGIILISKNGYLGIADVKGTILCDPIYDKIFPFHKELAVVCRNNRYGVVNQLGREIIHPVMNYIEDFNNDVALCITQEGKTCLLKKDGKILFENSSNLWGINGRYLYKDSQKISIISDVGKIIYTFNYNLLFNCKSDNRYINSGGWPFKSEYTFISNQKYRFRKKTNFYNNKFNAEPDLPFYFNEGFASVPEVENNVVKFGFIDTSGTKTIPCVYEDVHCFVNGYACVKQYGKWGVINKKGIWIVLPKYDYLENMNGYYFLLIENGKTGIITRDEQVLIKPDSFVINYLFGDVFAFLPENEKYKNKLINHSDNELDLNIDQWGAINVKTGDTILPFQYHSIEVINDNLGMGLRYYFTEDYSHFTNDQLNMLSKMSSKPNIDYQGYATSDIFTAQKKTGTYNSSIHSFYRIAAISEIEILSIDVYSPIEEYYNFSGNFIDSMGNIVNNPQIIQMLENHSNLMQLKIIKNKDSGKYGIQDLKGKMILPQVYDSLKISTTGIIARKNQFVGFLDLVGKEIIPFEYRFIEETFLGTLLVCSDEKGIRPFLIDKQNNKLN